MTNAQKLEALIERAIEGGWRMFGFRVDDYIPPWYIVKGGQMPTPKVVEKWVPADSLLICDMDDHYYVWEHFIFNKDFARALFKRLPMEPMVYEGIEPRLGLYQGDKRIVFLGEPAMFHLQQAVVSDNPIDYYYEQVFGKV